MLLTGRIEKRNERSAIAWTLDYGYYVDVSEMKEGSIPPDGSKVIFNPAPAGDGLRQRATNIEVKRLRRVE